MAAKSTKKSFAFFGEVLREEQVECSLFGTYELKRANENQILFLKTQVDRFQVFANDPVNRYEVKAIPGKEPHSKSFENLPNEKLGYFVIEHENVQLDRVFPLVVGLAKVDLTVVLQGNYLGLITSNGDEVPGMAHYPHRAANFYLDNHLATIEPKQIEMHDVKEMRLDYDSIIKFEKHKAQFPSIDKALDDFLKLQEISVRSPFKILNYFSILELLLTTYRPGSSYDSSLNSQLQNKLDLINKHLESPIDHAGFFKGPDNLTFKKIIAKLYEYRNNIAHGNESDFDNDLQIIGNNTENTGRFLRLILKMVLKDAIYNSKFISDLKKD